MLVGLSKLTYKTVGSSLGVLGEQLPNVTDGRASYIGPSAAWEQPRTVVVNIVHQEFLLAIKRPDHKLSIRYAGQPRMQPTKRHASSCMFTNNGHSCVSGNGLKPAASVKSSSCSIPRAWIRIYKLPESIAYLLPSCT